MMRKLQKYDLIVTCTTGKFRLTLDALLRAKHPATKPEKPFETEMQTYVHLIVKSLPTVGSKLQLIKTEVKKDNSLVFLKEMIVKG